MRLEDEGILDTHPQESQRPKRKEMCKRSKVWDYFIAYIDSEGKPRARCKYCERTYAVDPSKNGTSANNHMKCKKHPHNAFVADNQTIISFCQSIIGDFREGSSHSKFDQEAVRKALARMVIIDELSFKFVENKGFSQFISTACPQFIVPSRTTITRDCYRLFFDEKSKLIKHFKTSGQRILLTTDTWTSNQRLTYMCLTAHSVDSDCKMHKRIDKDFAIIVDNASSNDTPVAYFIRRMIRRN
ncbi:UNVERIFIED_CONTAM: Zinc finger BED domain-containing protein DAYSLEEPER [Sesamum latifolium]|uniref:Zinc finger BED domain-containing protein DAYSLEEPER n=1 Tax=Sesamum latifolium TaxID=2727402 RepID=A0AAW2VG54_9LAMI